MQNYNFYHDGNFIGSLALGSDSVAMDVANGCGATSFDNESTIFRKCAVCHAWHDIGRMKDGCCGWCHYLEQLQKFINHCESMLDKNWEDRDELYKEDFTITYRDQTLRLPFGAIEYNSIVECLKAILAENQE